MKVTYDTRRDALTVLLKDGVSVAERDEDKPGVILDYDEHGNLLSLDLARVGDPARGVEDLEHTIQRPRVLVRLEPVRWTTWTGREWHPRYR